MVLLDANVFFAPGMRDLFMHLHEAEVLNVHWTRAIEAEWARNVVAKQGAALQAIQACLRGMRDAAPAWEVTGYSKHAERFVQVDAKDRHVAAAAYKLSLDDWPGRRVALVTRNVRDFPQQAFEGSAVTRYGMAEYLDALHQEDPAQVASVVEGCRKNLQAPKLTREEYVGVLMKNGCHAVAGAMAERWAVECPALDPDGTLYYASERQPAATRQAARKARR